ncbi:hypothetical protein O0I10_012462 [Lichtheimia ornata]|uniref:Velvet domain-containing protein n=1 Tax=Lichtheimia ornata TaxID=688661 RepID=A0AAD7UQY8_9FUNG|nr:uncharacterized protein O0I10_012462 [Lichtheimia ornata]KAJ8651942.1 hypothetical protein O0I10_012462 [Lichtheimia ornata]
MSLHYFAAGSSRNNSNPADSCSYRFISSSHKDLPENRQYKLTVRQQPQQSKACITNDHDYRHSIDPAPILQLEWLNCSSSQTKQCLQSPFYFVAVNIVSANDTTQLLPIDQYLVGTTASSLYRLRDLDDADAGFFIFTDLAVKQEGEYRLHFSLFEIAGDNVQNRQSMLSDTFTAYEPKRFPGPLEPTTLSRCLYNQGIKMRIRKEYRRQAVNAKTATTRKRSFQIIDCQQQRNASPAAATSSKSNMLHKRSKHERTFLPAYATNDAYFGKWQTTLLKKQQEQQHATGIPSPPTSIAGTTPPPPDIRPTSHHYAAPSILHSSRCWGRLYHLHLIPFARQRSLSSHPLL